MGYILITGSAGFIGYHLSKKLLSNGFKVIGLDGFTNYYDVGLKKKRNSILENDPNFILIKGMLSDKKTLQIIKSKFNPKIIIHLAAQAGVRYSISNPDTYIKYNIEGTYEINKLAKDMKVNHLLIASTSSVYGSSTDLPFKENNDTNNPISIYAATKKSTEILAHSFSHIYNIPTTIFRFFTAYGPWGRPDMALFKFTRAILNEELIDIYNQGNMSRDFTYIDDIVEAIRLLINKKPSLSSQFLNSKVAPFRIVNIGNSKSIPLMDFVNCIEKKLNKKAKINFMEMQTGDVPNTLSDTDALKKITGFTPNISIENGISNFIDWYLKFYMKGNNII